MSQLAVPLEKPYPDGERMVDILMGRRACDKPPLVEYLVDDVHIKAIVTGMLGRPWAEPKDLESTRVYLDNYIRFWHRMGYDYVRLERSAGFTFPELDAEDQTMQDRQRHWQQLHTGPIGSWQDFENYPWPEVTDESLADIAYVNDHLPDGMGLIASHCAGHFEHLSRLFGYERLCMLIYDDPQLVQAVADRIGQTLERFYLKLVQLDRLIAIWGGDDMGFRSGTLIGPEHLRKYCLPWHRRFAQIAHEHELPYFLHSCGNLQAIYESLINDVKIDAKHSFEDAILPADRFHAAYSDRIGTLGGVDVDILAGKSPQQVRHRTREMIEKCAPKGRYGIGSGNSIPSYVPLENYMTMLDEALK